MIISVVGAVQFDNIRWWWVPDGLCICRDMLMYCAEGYVLFSFHCPMFMEEAWCFNVAVVVFGCLFFFWLFLLFLCLFVSFFFFFLVIEVKCW